MKCSDCPSYVKAEEVQPIFGRNTGVPMCGRYGHVLGRVGLSEAATDRLLEHRATTCDSFGQPQPTENGHTVPVSISGIVTEPDVAIMAAGKSGEAVSSCEKCQHRVPGGVVIKDLGFSAALCRAKGILIMKPRDECVACPWAKSSMSSTQVATTRGLTVIDMLTEEFRIDPSIAVQALRAHGGSSGDPLEYVTDVPVTDAAKKRGVLAWRAITSSQGHNQGKVQYLPIINPDFLTPEERARVPRPGDDAHPELYVDHADLLYEFAVNAYTLDEVLALIGSAGTGKTEAVRWWAYLMQVPFYRFSFNNESDPDEAIGTTHLRDGETVFIEGRVPLTWSARYAMTAYDEINAAPEAIRQMMRSCFDNSKELVIDAAQGVVKKRGEFSFFALTMNQPWDVRNTGIHELSAADASRMSPVLVEYPPEAVERSIIIDACMTLDNYKVPDDVLDSILKISADIREASKQMTYPGTWGIRENIKVARKTAWYPVPVAYKRAAFDLFDPAMTETTVNLISTIIGGDRPKVDFS